MADLGISEAIALSAAASAASAGAGLAAARMGGAKPPPLLPIPPKPDPDKGKIEEQRKLEQEAAMTGRQSTILTNDRPTSLLASVGQPAPYSNRTLGS